VIAIGDGSNGRLAPGGHRERPVAQEHGEPVPARPEFADRTGPTTNHRMVAHGLELRPGHQAPPQERWPRRQEPVDGAVGCLPRGMYIASPGRSSAEMTGPPSSGGASPAGGLPGGRVSHTSHRFVPNAWRTNTSCASSCTSSPFDPGGVMYALTWAG